MKRTLNLKTFRIPITRDAEGGVVIEDNVPLTEDMVINTEEEELTSPFIQLPGLTKKVKQYNDRQVKMAEQDKSLDYIKRKIITK